MPVKSQKQKRFLYAQVAEGKQWAKKYLEDSGYPVKNKVSNPYPKTDASKRKQKKKLDLI